MPTQERIELTLSKLIEQPITPAALGFILRIRHHFDNQPIAITQIMDLFDMPRLAHLSTADKHDLINELVANRLLHRYAFLGSIRYQSTLTLVFSD